MSEPKWTAGPWDTAGTLVYANRPRTGGTICQVSEVRYSHLAEHHAPDLGSDDGVEIFANARLIAAAPDFADIAARAQYLANERGGDYGTLTKDELCQFMCEFDDALSKARGEG